MHSPPAQGQNQGRPHRPPPPAHVLRNVRLHLPLAQRAVGPQVIVRDAGSQVVGKVLRARQEGATQGSGDSARCAGLACMRDCMPACRSAGSRSRSRSPVRTPVRRRPNRPLPSRCPATPSPARARRRPARRCCRRRCCSAAHRPRRRCLHRHCCCCWHALHHTHCCTSHRRSLLPRWPKRRLVAPPPQGGHRAPGR